MSKTYPVIFGTIRFEGREFVEQRGSCLDCAFSTQNNRTLPNDVKMWACEMSPQCIKNSSHFVEVGVDFTKDKE